MQKIRVLEISKNRENPGFRESGNPGFRLALSESLMQYRHSELVENECKT